MGPHRPRGLANFALAIPAQEVGIFFSKKVKINFFV
jgi:hypothetical protein